jgi:IS30 family transposase
MLAKKAGHHGSLPLSGHCFAMPCRAMDHELKMICDRLNATPRKCLGWKTPAEVFREKMMEEMGQSPYPQKE